MSCVYTINVNGLLYVGSTENEIHRVQIHISVINIRNTKLYIAIRANNNEFIFKVHHYFEGTTDELRQEEQKIIDELQPVLNEIRAYNSDEYNEEQKQIYNEDYYEKNKIEILKQVKEYYEKNKIAITEYNKKYCQANKSKIAIYQHNYRELKKDELIEFRRIKYEKNKIEIREKQAEKITCKCGKFITKSHILRHNLNFILLF